MNLKFSTHGPLGSDRDEREGKTFGRDLREKGEKGRRSGEIFEIQLDTSLDILERYTHTFFLEFKMRNFYL